MDTEELQVIKNQSKCNNKYVIPDRCFDISKTKATNVFQIPRYGHVHSSLTSSAFIELIYCWIGPVSDCYILHASVAGKFWMELDISVVLHVSNDSDEERNHDNPFQANLQKVLVRVD